MKITELGRKAVDHPQVRASFLDVAIMQLRIHKCPLVEFEEFLPRVVARYLAAEPARGGLGFRPDSVEDGIEEFITENNSIIQPIVQDTIKRAMESEDMGL